MDDKRKQLQQLGIATPPPPPVFGSASEDGTIVELSSTDDVKKLAEEATPRAFREIFNIGMGGGVKPAPSAVRLAALREVLDRALGKAAQHLEVEVTHTDIIKRIQRSRGKVIEGTAIEVMGDGIK